MERVIIKGRIIERMYNSILIIIMFLVMSIYSCTVQAQPGKMQRYIGLEGTFGTRSFTISSDIPEINSLQVIEEGGSVGVVAGTDAFKVTARVLGFYYSISSVSRTVNLFENEILVQYYPLHRLAGSTGLNVYITSGISLDKIKFYGHYLKEDTKVNYSDVNEPYLGKLSQLNATVGIGLEYRLPNVDFVHLFAEARYGIPVQLSSSTQAFENTTVKNFTAVSVGVSFGRKQ